MVVPFQAFSISFLLFLSLLASFRPTSALAGGRKGALCQKALTGPGVQFTKLQWKYERIVHTNNSVGVGWRGENGIIWYPATVKNFPRKTKRIKGVKYQSTEHPFDEARKYCSELGMRMPDDQDWISFGASMGGRSYRELGHVLRYSGDGFEPQLFVLQLGQRDFFISNKSHLMFDTDGGGVWDVEDYSKTYVVCVEDEALYTDRLGVRKSTGYQLETVSKSKSGVVIETGFNPKKVEFTWNKVRHRTRSGSTLTGWKDPAGRQWFETDFYGDHSDAKNYCTKLGLELPLQQDFRDLGLYLGAQVLPKYREYPSSPEDFLDKENGRKPFYQPDWRAFVFKKNSPNRESWRREWEATEYLEHVHGSIYRRGGYKPQVIPSLSVCPNGQGSIGLWYEEGGRFQGLTGYLYGPEGSLGHLLCVKRSASAGTE